MLDAKRIAILVAAGILTAVLIASAQSPEEDHQPSILGIQVGMSAQDVMDHLKRRADAAKDEKDRTFLYWKLEHGNILKIGFWKDHVESLELRYRKPRPTTDLWLLPLSSPASGTELTAPDPRFRRDYKQTQTDDRMRVVWTRQEKTHGGYHVQIEFWSTSRKEMGDHYPEFIEYKYVSVPSGDLKQFERAIQAPPTP